MASCIPRGKKNPFGLLTKFLFPFRGPREPWRNFSERCEEKTRDLVGPAQAPRRCSGPAKGHDWLDWETFGAVAGASAPGGHFGLDRRDFSESVCQSWVIGKRERESGQVIILSWQKIQRPQDGNLFLVKLVSTGLMGLKNYKFQVTFSHEEKELRYKLCSCPRQCQKVQSDNDSIHVPLS